jgi:hypothetical protein
VCSEKDKPGKDLNVKIAMWVCVLSPATGCFTLNQVLIPTPHREKQITYYKYHFSLCTDIF